MNSAISSPPLKDADVFPRYGSSLHYVLSITPNAQRSSLKLWLQWWHETACVPLNVNDPGVAETKLRWWQQAVHDAAHGRTQHPLLKALLADGAIAAPGRLPDWPIWQSQLDGLITLIHQTRWLDEASLQRHASMTTGAACEGASCILGAPSDAARCAARQIGLGVRLAHQLARLGQDARAGWVNVAIDVLQQHQVRAHQLSKPAAAQVPEGWSGLVAHLHAQASGALQEGLAQRRHLPRDEAQALKPLVALAHVHLQQIDAVISQGDRILHERIVLTPLRKWWISQRVRWGLLA
ncbi:MAG: squalene/phytoene synthase family protein [Aquabacterium sp.]